MIENSEIGHDSETLTSNTRELVDSNFNRRGGGALGAVALGRGIIIYNTPLSYNTYEKGGQLKRGQLKGGPPQLKKL